MRNPELVRLPGKTIMVSVAANAGDLLLDALLSTRTDSRGGNDRRDSNDDSEHGERRTELIHLERSKSDAHR
jgi:hypothetical protein